jgi:hypothetical protein
MGAIIQGAGTSELRWDAQRLEISLSRQVFGKMWDTFTVRSRQVSFGRFVCRCSTISCWRRKAFSNINSDLLRLRSRAAFGIGAWLSGLVQRRGSCMTAWQRACTRCRRKFIACLSRQSLEAMILPQNEVIGHSSRADGIIGEHTSRRAIGIIPRCL